MRIFRPRGLRGEKTDLTICGITDSQHSKGDLHGPAEIFTNRITGLYLILFFWCNFMLISMNLNKNTQAKQNVYVLLPKLKSEILILIHWFQFCYLTEMEKSPGELWLPRIRKAPTSRDISISSAEPRLALSLNQLGRESKYICVLIEIFHFFSLSLLTTTYPQVICMWLQRLISHKLTLAFVCQHSFLVQSPHDHVALPWTSRLEIPGSVKSIICQN